MNLKEIIPKPTEVVREGLIVLGGVLLAAFIIKRLPGAQTYVQEASITVKDAQGNILW